MFGTKAHLTAHDDHLFIEDVDSVDLAKEFGTPLYVTSEARLRQNIRAYHGAFPDADKYFAVKANGNLTVLRILAQEGAGADVFSIGELNLAGLAGIPKDKILFNGNSKSERDHRTALEAGVRISVDSREELESLSSVASELGAWAEVMFRINPDVSVKTHPKIATGLKTSKFGIPAEQVAETYQAAMDMPSIEPVGLHCHIGSQILDISPFAEAVARMMDVAQEVSSARRRGQAYRHRRRSGNTVRARHSSAQTRRPGPGNPSDFQGSLPGDGHQTQADPRAGTFHCG